jgi:regulator of protease activity HflC (stomatin/prohibitin superfamily)
MNLWSILFAAGLIWAIWHFRPRRIVVRDFETAVFRREGRFERLLEPGVHWLLLPSWQAAVVDLRPRLLDVTGQEVPTLDHGILRASAQALYVIEDARVFEESSQNAENELHLALQLALRRALAERDVETCFAERSAVDEALLAGAREAAGRLGLRVEAAGLKDLVAGGDLKRALAEVARARAEGRARLERARSETAAVRSLLNAARLVRENPGLYELRALETASKAAESEKNTLVLGLSREALDVLRPRE